MNPLEQQPAYGKMSVGKVPAPGTLIDIKGADRKYKWDIQKPAAQGGASTNFKGREVIESITTVHELLTTTDFLQLVTFRKAVSPKKEGDKPPALDVENAVLNNNEVKSIALASFGQETWDKQRTSWSVTVVWTEYCPPAPAQVGANDSSKASDPTKQQQPEVLTKAQETIGKLLKIAEAA